MKIEKGEKFYCIKLSKTRNLFVPLIYDLDKMIERHTNQISVLNGMINEHTRNIKAIKELKKYKKEMEM